MTEESIFSVPGFEFGNAQNDGAMTGCTVILCREGAVAGVDVRGGSPGTRETDALDPVNLRQSVHAVLLAGGSSFGHDAAAGVMRYLEARGIGRDVGVTRVPIVCGAILFDLKVGDWRVRPDGPMGEEACLDAERNARDAGLFREGNAGAGTGAAVGKIRGMERAMKGGLGSACFREGELLVGALIAVNCVGDVIDPATGKILAGVLSADRTKMSGTENEMLADYRDRSDFFSSNTIIGAVFTNALMTKAETNRLATVAHNGIARCVRPAHSVFDGDTLFALSNGTVAANADVIGILAVRAVERAIVNAVTKAQAAPGLPASRDFDAPAKKL